MKTMILTLLLSLSASQMAFAAKGIKSNGQECEIKAGAEDCMSPEDFCKTSKTDTVKSIGPAKDPGKGPKGENAG